ncbi:hypothetical protein BWQ96_00141 [Gracilariopsis chorda]|uniref:Uncharacterized protein n=1 Tax=Gracilariopsis chorda TaxID=448386 RepID=A0A2V3J6D1_9FLOR|nr:hypothetical protein BWQ96_00141 [Gracilariopsis chorda]|eukprot:PXF49981.1 hypothetical protein BWQ96_00141 [Gracilariopsis chorda]
MSIIGMVDVRWAQLSSRTVPQNVGEVGTVAASGWERRERFGECVGEV